MVLFLMIRVYRYFLSSPVFLVFVVEVKFPAYKAGFTSSGWFTPETPKRPCLIGDYPEPGFQRDRATPYFCEILHPPTGWGILADLVKGIVSLFNVSFFTPVRFVYFYQIAFAFTVFLQFPVFVIDMVGIIGGGRVV